MAAVERQMRRGITHMLPTEDAAWVGDELTRRFGVGAWQFALSASDANRWVLRLARQITGRSKVVVHDHCYHGSVDEAIAMLGPDGSVVPVRGSVGPQVDVAETTRVVEFNDVAGLAAALADGDVAAVLFEPALTNVGIVLPEPGYLDAVRELTRRTGTLLIIDETHTICAGPGGATGAWGLEPDVLVIGKTIGGGIPSAAYGFSPEVAARVAGSIDGPGLGRRRDRRDAGRLRPVARRDPGDARRGPDRRRVRADDRARGTLGGRGERGPGCVRRPVARDPAGGTRRVPLHARPPRTGAEQWAHSDPELERFLHLWAMNRRVLMTPFHNMALMSPATTEPDVDRHTDGLRRGGRGAVRMSSDARVRLRDVTLDDADLLDAWDQDREAIGEFNDFGGEREPVDRDALARGPLRNEHNGHLMVELIADGTSDRLGRLASGRVRPEPGVRAPGTSGSR